MHYVVTRLQTTKTNGGFSLVELLIAVAILVMIVAVTMQSFANYAKTQQFKRFVDEVGYSLKLARQQTLASKDASVYGVYVGTSTVEFFKGATPVPGSSNNTIIDFSSQNYSATSSFSDSSWAVTFARLTGEASATGTIILNSPDLGRTATITIHQSGLVE